MKKVIVSFVLEFLIIIIQGCSSGDSSNSSGSGANDVDIAYLENLPKVIGAYVSFTDDPFYQRYELSRFSNYSDCMNDPDVFRTERFRVYGKTASNLDKEAFATLAENKLSELLIDLNFSNEELSNSVMRTYTAMDLSVISSVVTMQPTRVDLIALGVPTIDIPDNYDSLVVSDPNAVLEWWNDLFMYTYDRKTKINLVNTILPDISGFLIPKEARWYVCLVDKLENGTGQGLDDRLIMMRPTSPEVPSEITELQFKAYAKVIQHELVHVLVNNISNYKNDADLWFNEGLAMHLAGQEVATSIAGLQNPLTISTHDFSDYPNYALLVQWLFSTTGASNSADSVFGLFRDISVNVNITLESSFRLYFDNNFNNPSGIPMTLPELEKNWQEYMNTYLGS